MKMWWSSMSMTPCDVGYSYEHVFGFICWSVMLCTLSDMVCGVWTLVMILAKLTLLSKVMGLFTIIARVCLMRVMNNGLAFE